MKKAGIILGVFFIIIAILLCVFGLKYIEKGQTEQPNTEVSENMGNNDVQTPTVEQPIEQQPMEQQPPVVEQTPEVVEKVVEKVVTKEVSGVMTIDESGLGEPVATKEVIVHITNKNNTINIAFKKLPTFLFFKNKNNKYRKQTTKQ